MLIGKIALFNEPLSKTYTCIISFWEFLRNVGTHSCIVGLTACLVECSYVYVLATVGLGVGFGCRVRRSFAGLF